MLKFVIDFVSKNRKPIVVAILIALAFWILVTGINRVGDYFQNKKYAALEQTIQTSEAKIQQLEGQLQVTTATLSTVNKALEESNARVANAEAGVDRVRTVYVATKAKGPTFVSTDVQGQVKELTDVLNGLYP